jgi:hypothetical protein
MFRLKSVLALIVALLLASACAKSAQQYLETGGG